MKRILVVVRKEAVLLAGAGAALLDLLVANGPVLTAIVPVLLSLLTRSQVSPVSKLLELGKLVDELRLPPKAAPPGV